MTMVVLTLFIQRIAGIPVIRITYTGYDNEIKSGTYLQDKAEAILKKMGATSVVRGPYLFPPATNHEVGGARMGDDPAKAVVNKYQQSHELPNLFVASGATFPTYFGYNPTHTIESLELLVGRLLKIRASPVEVWLNICKRSLKMNWKERYL